MGWPDNLATGSYGPIAVALRFGEPLSSLLHSADRRMLSYSSASRVPKVIRRHLVQEIGVDKDRRSGLEVDLGG